MKTELASKGYCVSPNNIHGLPGVIMYPSGPGVPSVLCRQSVQVLPDRIRVFEETFYGTKYSRASYWDTVTVAVFDSVAAFLAWCPTVSKGGINHLTGPNVWD